MTNFLLLIFTSLTSVYGHSWLHCSDYDSTINGQDFVEDDCNGYIRQWSSTWGATEFANDRGVNYQPNGAWCQTPQHTSGSVEDLYDSGYPYATWNYEDEITLVWPAKNHANYECFSNIPDTSMKLFINPNVNPTSDISYSSGDPEQDGWEELIDWHDGCTAGTDECGFQNCPDFCDETDDAPCFQKYTVSSNDFPDAGMFVFLFFVIFCNSF